MSAGPDLRAAGCAPPAPGGRSVRGMRLVLFTDRPEQAVAFLRDGLGLPVVADEGGAGRDATVFAAGPAHIEVVSEGRRIGAGVGLRLEVDHLDAFGEGLASCGLRPLGPIEMPWGDRVCGVGGPGGMLVELVEGAGRAAAGAGRPATRVPDLAVVTCVDLGDDPLAPLGLEPGDAHMVTNAGGVVTADTVRDLVAARRSLGVRRVTVVQHEGCAFTDPGPLPALWPPDPVERLRASLTRLTRPPLSLPRRAVEGLLHRPAGASLCIAPGP